MNFKKIKLIALFVMLIGLTSNNAQTVYVTKEGKKYHAKNCGIAKTGKSGMELAEAKKQGYEACKSCKSHEIAPAADKPKEQPKAKKK